MDFCQIEHSSPYVRLCFVQRPEDLDVLKISGMNEVAAFSLELPKASNTEWHGVIHHDNEVAIKKAARDFCRTMIPSYEETAIESLFVRRRVFANTGGSNQKYLFIVIVTSIPIWVAGNPKIPPSVKFVKEHGSVPLEGYGMGLKYFPNDIVTRECDVNIQDLHTSREFRYEEGSYLKQLTREKKRNGNRTAKWLREGKIPWSFVSQLIRCISDRSGIQKSYYLSLYQVNDTRKVETSLMFLDFWKVISKKLTKKQMKFFKYNIEKSLHDVDRDVLVAWSKMKVTSKTKKKIRLFILLSKRILLLLKDTPKHVKVVKAPRAPRSQAHS